MGRDKLLKVKDSVSFRAINKIINYYIRYMIDKIRIYTFCIHGAENDPFTFKHSPQAENAIILSLYDQKGNSNKFDRKISTKTYPTVVRLTGKNVIH